MHRICLKNLLGSLAIAAAGLLPPTAAQAVVVSGNWDPAYGAPFTNLGWRGSVALAIPDDCSELPAGVRLVGAPGCSTPWTVLSALVEFYDVTNPLPTVETLDFSDDIAVDAIRVSLAAEIDSFATSIVSTVAGTTLLGTRPGDPVGFTLWALQFSIEAGGQTGATLFWRTLNSPCGPLPGCFEGRNAIPVLFRVGERGPVALAQPGALALLLPGLLALLLLRRRRGG